MTATPAVVRRQGLRTLRRPRQALRPTAATATLAFVWRQRLRASVAAWGVKGRLKGKLFGILHPHRGDIKYFVGPGGPVPLTPGYVPYVVPTRSPRDFLAFPPYTPENY